MLKWPSVAVLVLCAAASIWAQRNTPDPLTDKQQQAIAEAGIFPAERIGLYIKFVNERAEIIKRLIPRSEAARGRRIDGELQNFTALIDELASNLDEYGSRQADLRKVLKPLDESVPQWQDLLKQLPNDPTYEIARKDASEAVGDLADQAKSLTSNQEQYFKDHKEAKGQERSEPQ